MKKLLVILLISALGSTYASEHPMRKPLFKKLEFAYYEKDKTGAFDISFYIKVDNSGRVFIAEIYKLDSSFYTYVLADSVIEILNTIYDGTKPLKSYLVQDRLENGIHYAGDYSFLAVRRKDNKVEYLTYIDPFMEDRFKESIQAIFETFDTDKRNGQKRKFEISKSFLKSLSNNHKKTKNLPEKELPPVKINSH